MAQKKAHEVDGYLVKPDPRHATVLIYGPDRGLVSERAEILAGRCGADLSDPFSVVKLEASEVSSDVGRLLDEAKSLGLFGGKRLVWVKNAGNERGLIEAVRLLGDEPPADAVVLIEAGDLKKTSGLRKAAEAAPAAIALPCYADEGRSIHALIDAELSESGFSLTPDARRLLAASLGGDRLASRSELRKLVLYARGSERITETDVAAIVGDAAGLSVEEATDAVLSGNLAVLDEALSRMMVSKTSTFLVLQGCLRQFQLADQLRARMDERGQTEAQVIQEAGRQIHFKRKASIETALRNWSSRALAGVLMHLQAAIMETRRRPALEDSIARQALLAVAVRSART